MPRASIPRKILVLNERDLENPRAGGAEVHIFEIFSRLVERGHEVRLFATEKKNEPRDIHAWDTFKAAQAKRFPRMKLDRTLCPPHGANALPKKPYDCKWEDANPPLLVRAMVSTKDYLFIAGPEDSMDEKDYYFPNASKGYEQMQSDLEKQSDIWCGKGGGILHVISKENGTRVAGYQLAAMPVFDGMIAANGRLYLSTVAGKVVSYEGRQ